MAGTRANLDDVHFGELVGVLSEADVLGVLLRGHLWVEALLEYAARGKLERPNAIRWAGSRFEHKVALAEAVGALDAGTAIAVRGFNRLRNRLAHDLDFEITEGDVMTIIGHLNPRLRKIIDKDAQKQLDIYYQVEKARSEGADIEWDPQLEWYPRVMTPTRAYLFAFVIRVARDLAFEGALGAFDKGETDNDPQALLAFLDREVDRLTGGMFRFRPSTGD